jgi:hypothetical protein
MTNNERTIGQTNNMTGWDLGLPPSATHSATDLQQTSNNREKKTECRAAGNAATRLQADKHTTRKANVK